LVGFFCYPWCILVLRRLVTIPLVSCVHECVARRFCGFAGCCAPRAQPPPWLLTPFSLRTTFPRPQNLRSVTLRRLAAGPSITRLPWPRWPHGSRRGGPPSAAARVRPSQLRLVTPSCRLLVVTTGQLWVTTGQLWVTSSGQLWVTSSGRLWVTSGRLPTSLRGATILRCAAFTVFSSRRAREWQARLISISVNFDVFY
jgi:hypothetical protein